MNWTRHRCQVARSARWRSPASGPSCACAGGLRQPTRCSSTPPRICSRIDISPWLHSTNPLERLNKEIKRRSNVVGIFPTPQSVIRLVGAILEQDDEGAVAERRYFSAESMKQFTAPTLPATAQEIFAAIA